MKRVYRFSSSSSSPLSPATTHRNLNPYSLALLTKSLSDPFTRNFCPETQTQTRPSESIWPKFSGLFLNKLVHATALPAHRADLVERVSILRDELLAIGDDKEQFDSLLDEKGSWLFRCYRDGAGVVELMDQLFLQPHLALQVFDWRRKEVNCCIPLTSEEYAKGIKLAGRTKDINLAVILFDEAAQRRVRTTVVYNALMGAYVGNGLADECRSLFRDFKKQVKCAPSVVTYNIMISVYGRLLLVNNMEAAFEELRKSNLVPNSRTYNNLIAGYMTAWNWEKMEATFQLMKSGPVKPDINTYELMLRGYANSGNLVQMEEMYGMIKDQIGKSRTPLIKAMICAYCKNVVEDRVKRIENLLRLISEEKYTPWLNVLLIRLYAQEDILEAMENSINEAFEHKTCVNTSCVMRAIISSYFRCNAVDSLANFVKRAESAGWIICRSLYHCMMIMYGSQKRFEEMEGVLSKMEEFNYGLVRKTFYIMYKAYAMHGIGFKANQVVGMMLKYGYLTSPLFVDTHMASSEPEIV